ncbi:hypothetical protein F53441_13616 [Fusarium austroafricanum]|uniref:Uncharacterized protein n=1 Tax=Fusarium austroafricanum TaxID=2364996 RepID=A0A8H4NQF0_9HYPO|nr:hypothetical protein F53441_13616 [Fusarium austroafricanum]
MSTLAVSKSETSTAAVQEADRVTEATWLTRKLGIARQTAQPGNRESLGNGPVTAHDVEYRLALTCMRYLYGREDRIRALRFPADQAKNGMDIEMKPAYIKCLYVAAVVANLLDDIDELRDYGCDADYNCMSLLSGALHSDFDWDAFLVQGCEHLVNSQGDVD